jgi:phosphotriesterase-related protein
MIQTVLGPIPAGDLGVTSMNEHLVADSAKFLRPAREPVPETDVMAIENLGFVRWNFLGLRDNLVLDQPEVTAHELRLAVDRGQRSLVEVTSWGMGPDHASLPAIARASGMQIAVAYGSYIAKSLPQFVLDATEDELETLFHGALEVEIPGAGYRAAMLGLMGTSAEIAPVELRALRAASRAAARTGASVSIRLDASARQGPAVLEILLAEGMRADRVIFSNVDKVMDLGYVAEMGSTGATLEVAFGEESYFGDTSKDATDAERLRFLLTLLEQHPDFSVVLACSVWTKAQLASYGGMGYGHMVGRIVPVLERAGVSPARLHDMLVARPRFLLDRP